MRERGRFAAVSVAIGVPLALIAVGAAIPPVRHAVEDIFSPVPLDAPAPSASAAAALPPDIGVKGAESKELASLLHADAGTNARAPRSLIFPTDLPAPDSEKRTAGMKRPDIASRDDSAVDVWVNYLAHDFRGRAAFTPALTRTGQYRFDVERVLRGWKIPVELFALVVEESAAVPSYSSSDGGAGFWSLRPDVALAYGLKILPTYDERFAVVLATEAAAHYLTDLHERFGSWELAIFAFGAGYARTVGLLPPHNAVDFWQVAPKLPSEDARYVHQVLAIATVLANLEKLSFGKVPIEDHVETSDLEIPPNTALSDVAFAAGTGLPLLRKLNPEYLGASVPKTGVPMVMHLPSAGLARAKEMLLSIVNGDVHVARTGAGADAGGAQAEDETAGAPKRERRVVTKGRFFYDAKEGDTLASVAQHFGVPLQTLANDNALDPTATLRAGQLLTVRANTSDNDTR